MEDAEFLEEYLLIFGKIKMDIQTKVLTLYYTISYNIFV